MEPAAPGTEDEVPFTLNKQANEHERLLNLKTILPNGVYGNVFTLSYNLSGSAQWYCNVCVRPIMGRVYLHEQGKRHCLNMAYRMGEDTKPPGVDDDAEEPPPIQVAPGEPLPPGFEGQVEETTMIQEKLDNFKATPLVALEYLLEMQYYDPQKEPLYLCVLCDKKGDPRTVLTHLSSYNHISHYLQKHFPSCYRKLAPYMTKVFKRGWQTVLMNIAEAIEQKFGRLKPIPIEKDKFDADMTHYLGIICKGRHFTEAPGATFEELVTPDVLFAGQNETVSNEDKNQPPKKRSPSPPKVAKPTKKPKPDNAPPARPSNQPPAKSNFQRERKYSISSVSSISSSDNESDRGNYRGGNNRRNQPEPRYNNRRKSRDRSPRDNYQRRDRPQQRSMPWEKSNYNRPRDKSPERKPVNSKIDEYKRLAKAIESDMNRVLAQNEKNPEKHPQYNEEWKKFWNKRYKELSSEGKDATNYDFKPEWIKFWNKRMIELHQDEIRSKKEALRKRLGMPEEPPPISFRIGGRKPDSKDTPTNTNKPLPTAAVPDDGDDVILIEDDSKPTQSKPKDSSKRSVSPWESQGSRDKRPLPRRRSRSRSWDRRRPRSRSPERKSRSRDLRSKSREKSPKYRESSFERDLRSRERIRTVHQLPWERQKYYDDYYKPPAVMRDVTRQPMVLPPPKLDDEDENEEVNLVSVLRLLTAVEERLGSLGPKVIDLLAQALAMEKNEANSSESLLNNDVNCVLFETVKEKLKGQLLAGLVDPFQERAFKKAIKNTASLLHFASKKQSEISKNAKVSPVSVPGVGTVDKAAIARQIATALIAQGKTDVTQDQLEQLINAVVGMAEASKKAGKTISTASFLEKLSGGGDIASSSMPPAENKTKIEPPPLENLTEPLTPSPKSSSTQNMDHLSDSDLQTLLQNFKDLQPEEQHQLINYLKKLETYEPERVERLRKFVNPKTTVEERKEVNVSMLEDIEDSDDGFEETDIIKKKDLSGRESPFSKRLGDLNPISDNKPSQQKIILDSEDEDYTFEDVVKAVSKNVKAKELEKERQIVEDCMKKSKDAADLVDAKSIISTLMNNFKKNNNSMSNLFGLGASTSVSVAPVAPPTQQQTTSWSNIPLNMDSIANIVGNAQKMVQEQNTINKQLPAKKDFLQNPSKQDFLQNPSKQEFLEDFPPVQGRVNIDPFTLGTDSSSAKPKPTIIQNIVLNRVDKSNQPSISSPLSNLGMVRPNFEPNRPDLMPPKLNFEAPKPLVNQQQPPWSNGGPNGPRMNRPPMMGNQGPVPRPNFMQNMNVGNPYGGGGGNNFPQNNYPSQQNNNFQRGNGPPFDQRARFNNPRFQGNQFNNRPSGNFNRW